MLSRIVECEERGELVSAAIDPREDTAWLGPMRLLTADGSRTTRVFGDFRYHEEGRLRGILLEVEKTGETALVNPTYRNDATVALLGGTAALIDLVLQQIIEWLTPPLPDIAWRHHPSSVDTAPIAGRHEFNLGTTHLVHTDDRPLYVRTLGELAAGRVDSGHIVVRLLTVEHDWKPMELYARRLPNGPARLLVCTMRPAGELPLGPVAASTSCSPTEM
jgi:hypothetical protein